MIFTDVIQALARGAKSTAERTALSTLMDLEETSTLSVKQIRDLANKKIGRIQSSYPSDNTQSSDFVVGKIYRNSKGQKGRYLGDGKWEGI